MEKLLSDPGPWSQSYIFFFGDHESDIIHR